MVHYTVVELGLVVEERVDLQLIFLSGSAGHRFHQAVFHQTSCCLNPVATQLPSLTLKFFHFSFSGAGSI